MTVEEIAAKFCLDIEEYLDLVCDEADKGEVSRYFIEAVTAYGQEQYSRGYQAAMDSKK